MQANPILGKYTLYKTLGSGTYSKVKLGLDKATGEKVAIKVHKPETLEHLEETRKVIENEIVVMKKLSHPNIVNILDYLPEASVTMGSGKKLNVYFVVIEEYCQEGELFFFVKNSGHFTEKYARYLFHEIINGLEFMHQNGFAHRDIKPDNILVDANFNIKIADFGYAGALSGKNGTGFMSTYCGTKPYQAPEINLQRPYKGEDVDLFAAAIVLFIMVSGIPPFTCAEPQEFYYKFLVEKNYDKYWSYHYKGKPNGDKFFTQEFKTLMQKMLAYNPKERLSMEELKKDPWYTGELPTKEEILAEFTVRKQRNDESQPVNKESSAGEDGGQKKRYRGGPQQSVPEEDSKAEEEIKLSKEIEIENDDLAMTKIVLKEDPDVVFDALEAYVNEKKEEENIEINVNENLYKAKIIKDTITVGIKAYIGNSKDFFIYEITRKKGELMEFLDFYNNLKKSIEITFKYISEENEEEQQE